MTGRERASILRRDAAECRRAGLHELARLLSKAARTAIKTDRLANRRFFPVRNREESTSC